MLIPALALTAVGVVLVRQQGELIDRRAEDQGRLMARELADSLEAELDRRTAALPLPSSDRYPANNGILNLGSVTGTSWSPPFPAVTSTIGSEYFQALLTRFRQVERSGRSDDQLAEDYRAAALARSEPDQRAYLFIQEARFRPQPSDEILELIQAPASLTDEFGWPLALYAMQAIDSTNTAFAPNTWLNLSAIEFARDLGLDDYAQGEHDVLRYVRDRYAAIEGWRLDPTAEWMITRQNEAFFGIRVDSLGALLPTDANLGLQPSEASVSMAPTFPFLFADIPVQDTGLPRALWVVALVLVLAVTTFASLLLFRDARRERRLAELRARFVSSVSHEVRTPLAAIRLYTDSLLTYGPGTEDEWRQDLETISWETDRLTRMLDNVLRASRIERGTDRYHMAEGNLAGPVSKAIDAMRPTLIESSCQVEADLNELSATFDGDAIEQAVVNLLSNAAKYAPSSLVKVSCLRQNGHAIIEVADSGPGMGEEARRHAFEPYYRADQQASGSKTGTGLGLSLVRHIARGHEGDVSLDTEPGRGCRFTITIPIPS